MESIYKIAILNQDIQLANDDFDVDRYINVEGIINVFLTFSNNKERGSVFKGSGDTLSLATKNAIEKFQNEQKPEIQPTMVKLDIVKDIIKFKSAFRLTKDLIIYDRGIEGISLDESLNVAFLPQEITAYGLINKKKFHLGNIIKALGRRTRDVFLDFVNILDKNKNFVLRKFTTDAYFYDGKTFAK